MDFERARFNMVEQQIRPWDVLDFRLLYVLQELPRELFVSEHQKPYAYADMHLALPNKSLMIEPKIVARLIQALNLQETDSVLETPLATLQACREDDGEWYIGIYCGAISNDQILDCAQYVESVSPDTVFAYTTNDAKVMDTEDGGIFKKLKDLSYRHSFGQYSSKNDDAVCAIIGWAMVAMTGTINSAFTLAYKTEVGVETENSSALFSSAKVNAIKGNYGNVYINRGSYYNVFEEGTMADGTWFDEVIYLDKYKNDMQLAVMDLLYQNNKIAQTEAGMTRIKDAIKVVCEDMNRIGFIATGVWKSNDILNLAYGATLPSGYMIQSEPIDEQSQADRDARKAPPIYVSLKLAGAIHHVTIQVDVNR